MGVLADLDAALAADLTVAHEQELKAFGALAQAGRKALAGFMTRLAGEAKHRETTGSGAATEDVVDPDGDQSAEATDTDTARAGIAEPLPLSGGAAGAGAARVENADHLAKRTGGLSETELARLAAHDRTIARNQASMRPEKFRIWLDRLIAEVRDRDDDELSAAEKAILASAFRLIHRPDGSWDIIGRLDDERGTIANDIVERRARQIADHRPAGQRAVTNNDRAAAFFDLVTRRTGAGGGPILGTEPGAPSGPWDDPAPGKGSYPGAFGCLGDDDLAAPARMGVGVIIDAHTLLHGPHPGSVAEHWRGGPVDPRAAARLACDTDVYAILYDQIGRPVTVGCTRRSATRAHRLALRGLYPTCPIDDTTPFWACDVHHVNVPFEAGGETELHNLVPISKRWHHRIHDDGWKLTMDADRTLHLTRPDGTHDRTIPPPRPITRHGP